jgi:hypothetical protein
MKYWFHCIRSIQQPNYISITQNNGIDISSFFWNSLSPYRAAIKLKQIVKCFEQTRHFSDMETASLTITFKKVYDCGRETVKLSVQNFFPINIFLNSLSTVILLAYLQCAKSCSIDSISATNYFELLLLTVYSKYNIYFSKHLSVCRVSHSSDHEILSLLGYNDV